MTEYNDTPASKTRRKQDMQALQEVGLTLMGLKPEQRARLPLTDGLEKALEEARRITNLDARHNSRLVADPDIIANYCIAFIWIAFAFHGIFPVTTKNGKRIRRDGLTEMVGAIHNKSNVVSNHTELANDQLITNKVKEVFDIFLKIMDILKVIVIGIVSHNDIWVLDYVFQKTKSIVMR
mgnify:CR=1 FL=1